MSYARDLTEEHKKWRNGETEIGISGVKRCCKDRNLSEYYGRIQSSPAEIIKGALRVDASFLSPWNGPYEVGIRQLDPDQCALRSNNPPFKLVTGGRSPRYVIFIDSFCVSDACSFLVSASLWPSRSGAGMCVARAVRLEREWN